MEITYIVIMFLARIGLVMNQAPEAHSSRNVRSTLLCIAMLLRGVGWAGWYSVMAKVPSQTNKSESLKAFSHGRMMQY